LSTQYYNPATQTCGGKSTSLQRNIKPIFAKNVIPVAQLAQDQPQINVQAVKLISIFHFSSVFHAHPENIQQMV